MKDITIVTLKLRDKCIEHVFIKRKKWESHTKQKIFIIPFKSIYHNGFFNIVTYKILNETSLKF